MGTYSAKENPDVQSGRFRVNADGSHDPLHPFGDRDQREDGDDHHADPIKKTTHQFGIGHAARLGETDTMGAHQFKADDGKAAISRHFFKPHFLIE